MFFAFISELKGNSLIRATLLACFFNFLSVAYPTETAIEIEESVRGKDIYILQTGTK